MTFDALKSAILLEARRGGMCEPYHSVKVATTYQELIEATTDLFMYGWKNGIVNDSILDEFDDSLLLSNGIYYNKYGAVPAPTIPMLYYDAHGYEVICVGGSPIISYSGLYKYKVTAANSNVTIHLADDCYLMLDAFNCTGALYANDNTVANVNLQNRNEEEFFAEIKSEATIYSDFSTKLTLNIGPLGFTKLFSSKKSDNIVNIGIDDSRIFAITSQQSKITYNTEA